VLLLDEPARGLDERLRLNFYLLLGELRQRLTLPMLLVSHDLEDCFGLADAVILLENGKILQAGARQDVLGKPVTVAAARAFGIFNIAPAEILSLDPGANSSRIRVFQQDIYGPYVPGHLIGDQGYVCLRRSELHLAEQADTPSGNRLRLKLKVRAPAVFGVRLTLEDDFTMVVRESELHSRKEGTDLTVAFPSSAVSFVGK
jgi:ABC-type sulfate/molybdate transport systems ATPase subunit